MFFESGIQTTPHLYHLPLQRFVLQKHNEYMSVKYDFMKGFFTSVFSVRVLLVLVVGCGIVERGVGQSEPEWTIHEPGIIKTFDSKSCPYSEPTMIGDTLKYCQDNLLVSETHYGITGTSINAILEASDGTLYIGTDNGLATVNDSKWRNYTEHNSDLPHERITHLVEANTGEIYLSTNSGISILDNGTWSNFDTKNSNLPSSHITDLAINSSNDLIIGSDVGVIQFDGINWTLSNSDNSNIPTDFILCLLVSGDTIYAGTDNGLSKQVNGTWELFPFYDSWNNPSRISTLAEGTDGSILVGSGHHTLSSFNGQIATKIENGSSYIGKKSLVQTSEGIIYSGREGWITKNENGEISHISLSSPEIPGDSVRMLHKNQNGDLYVGTNYGVAKYDGSNWSSIESWSPMMSLIGQNNELFISTPRGLIEFSNQTWKLHKADLSNSEHDLYVSDLHQSLNGNIYCKLSSGLGEFNGTDFETHNSDNPEIHDDNLHFIDLSNSDEIIASSYSGVSRFNGETWSNINIPLETQGWRITAIQNSIPGIILLGTSNKGFWLQRNNIWTNFNSSNSPISSDRTTCLHQSIDSTIYIGSYDSGLTKFDGLEWEVFNTTNSPLPDNHITCVLKTSDSSVYIGTTKGLTIIKDNVWYTFTTVNSLFTDSYIRSIRESQKGDICITTNSNILVIRKKGGNEKKHTVSGVVFWDANNNSNIDNGETILPNQLVRIIPTNQFTFTNNQGIYKFQIGSGNFTVQAIPNIYWDSTSISKAEVTISNSSILNANLGLTPQPEDINLISDLVFNNTRCGFPSHSYLNYSNKGNTTENSIIALELDSKIEILESNTISDSSNLDGTIQYWHHNDLAPFESGQIQLTLQMPGVEHIGDTLRSYATISTLDGSYSHTDTLESVLTCAYDPNDKLVKPLGIEEDHLTLFGDDLTYTVRFQNTGNDTAFTVVVKDTIDFNLDMNTFEVLASSHEVYTLFDLEGNVSFTFNDIMLPDSNINELESHGFVTFKISPKAGLEEYTEINNTAYIFFDFNPAIVTNETWNTMVSSLTVSAIEEDIRIINSSSAAPNPFSEATTIHFDNPSNTNHSLELFDVTGKIIKSISDISGSEIELNRNKLRTGLYFYSITENTSGEVFTGKLVVE